MDLVPRKVWVREDDKRRSRVYDEIMTGDLPFAMQVNLKPIHYKTFYSLNNLGGNWTWRDDRAGPSWVR